MPEDREEPEDEEDEAEVPLDELEELAETRDQAKGEAAGEKAQRPVQQAAGSKPGGTANQQGSQSAIKPDEVAKSDNSNTVVRPLDKDHRLNRGRTTRALSEGPGTTAAESEADHQLGRSPQSSGGQGGPSAFENGEAHHPYVRDPTGGRGSSASYFLNIVAVVLAAAALAAVFVAPQVAPVRGPTPMFAAVDANGTIEDEAHVVGGVTVTSTGDYNLTFDRNVSQCTFVANPGQWPGSGTPAPSTLPYRTSQAPDNVYVRTGGALGAFFLTVIC